MTHFTANWATSVYISVAFSGLSLNYIAVKKMTDSLLFQIQMSEHKSLLWGGELYMTIFSSFSANCFPQYHTILAINCVHASNWFTQYDKLHKTLLKTICMNPHIKI